MTERDITLCGHGGGTPSIKNMEEYLDNRYNQFATNGLRKGIVCVKRPKGWTDEGRQKFHDAYSTILGRNIYSQDQALREYVFRPYNGNYYSDCSSSGDACYAKAGIDIGWANTAGIYYSGKMEDVAVVIDHGHIKNPEILKVGDALLFRGNDPTRPRQIGHVEYVYEIKKHEGWHWVQDGDDWYFQDDDGRNTYGWKLIKESGSDATHWFYFLPNGRMATGIIEYNGEPYYLMEKGDLEGACCRTDSKGALKVWNVAED